MTRWRAKGTLSRIAGFVFAAGFLSCCDPEGDAAITLGLPEIRSLGFGTAPCSAKRTPRPLAIPPELPAASCRDAPFCSARNSALFKTAALHFSLPHPAVAAVVPMQAVRSESSYTMKLKMLSPAGVSARRSSSNLLARCAFSRGYFGPRTLCLRERENLL
jgi:hypothetical protein